MTKIIMHGCNGKMGKVICGLVKNDADAEIVAGIDMTSANTDFPVFTNIKDCNIDADVIIDFSTASAVINLLATILKKYSEVLYDAGFDVEIVERHHNQKIDAPSGTAILLGDAVNEGVGNQLEYVYDRSQVRQKRDRRELGFSAVRGGTIVGDHEVIFAGKDEVVEFKHSAHSKEVFAVGAVKAAKFIKGKKAGKYDMQDVMAEI